MSDSGRGAAWAMRLITPVMLLGLAALLIWGVQAVPDAAHAPSPRPSGPTPVVRVTNRMVILHGVAVLAPAPPSANPALTFDEAFARNAGPGVTHPLVPGTAYLGLLFVGNGRHYRLRNHLGYAYVYRSACRIILSPGASPPPPRQCDHWTFLDAATGHSYGQLQVPAAKS